MARDRRLALLARFRHGAQLLAAARALRAEGRHLEPYSPFPIPGMDRVIGFSDRRVPLSTLAGALAGFVLALAGQWWMNAWDYPLNVGGRPLAAWTAFVVSAIEVALMTGVLAGGAVMLRLNELGGPPHRWSRIAEFRRVTSDAFLIWVELADAAGDQDHVRQRLRDLGGEDILEVEE